MTNPNPLPACLSHLSQRDAAVRARALEEALNVIDEIWPYGSRAVAAVRKLHPAPMLIPARPSPAPDEAVTRHHPAEMELDEIEELLNQTMGPRWRGFRGPADALGVLLHENEIRLAMLAPNARAPDEAEIRAELVAALRAMMTGSEYGSTTWDGEVHPPKWTVIRMPTKEALDQARAAIARYDSTPGEQP